MLLLNRGVYTEGDSVQRDDERVLRCGPLGQQGSGKAIAIPPSTVAMIIRTLMIKHLVRSCPPQCSRRTLYTVLSYYWYGDYLQGLHAIRRLHDTVHMRAPSRLPSQGFTGANGEEHVPDYDSSRARTCFTSITEPRGLGSLGAHENLNSVLTYLTYSPQTSFACFRLDGTTTTTTATATAPTYHSAALLAAVAPAARHCHRKAQSNHLSRTQHRLVPNAAPQAIDRKVSTRSFLHLRSFLT